MGIGRCRLSIVILRTSDNFKVHAIGTFMGIAFLGQGLNTAIGGLISNYFNWRGVFVIYSLMAALVTVLILTI